MVAIKILNASIKGVTNINKEPQKLGQSNLIMSKLDKKNVGNYIMLFKSFAI